MRTSYSMLLLPFALVLGACGKWAHAGSESVVTLPVPEYPKIQDDVFSLNSSKSKTDYKGTLIIFDDAARPELLSKVITASINARDAWGDIKKFEVESNYVGTYTDGGYAHKNLELMRDGIQAFEVEALNKNPLTLAARLENARTFMSREIDSLNLSSDQRTTFDNQFAAYCEAKVLEFATHPAASLIGFKSIPYPAAICQDYYTANAYFTGPSCVNVANGDFTKCLWTEGMLKTRWFAVPSNDAALAVKRSEKRARAEALLNDSNYPATRGVLNFSPSSFVTTASTAIKKLWIEKKEAYVSLALDQKADSNNCPKAIANVGSQDLCRIFGIAPEAVSPRAIISAVEGSSTANEALFAKLPLPEGREVSTQNIIRYLGERIRADSSTNDRIFLDSIDGSLFPQPSFSGKEFNEVLPQIRQVLSAEFYGTLSDSDKARKQEKLNAIEVLENEIQTKRSEWDRLNKNIGDTTDIGISAANEGKLAVGFLQYQMAFEQAGTVLQARWFLQEAREQVFQACYDLATNQEAACFLPEKPGTSYYPANIKLTEGGARMDFSFKVTSPITQGFGTKARHDADRKPDFFMDLQESSWFNRTLRFELYRNRIKEYLDIITGKSFIENDDAREFEGAVSSWEQAD